VALLLLLLVLLLLLLLLLLLWGTDAEAEEVEGADDMNSCLLSGNGEFELGKIARTAKNNVCNQHLTLPVRGTVEIHFGQPHVGLKIPNLLREKMYQQGRVAQNVQDILCVVL